MPEANATAIQEASVSLELPRNRHLVTLPPIRENGLSDFGVRLGMHIDSILTFLRALHGLTDLDQLKVEGRVLNRKQEKALEASQKYQFYMSSRVTRGQLLVPQSVRLTSEGIAEATQAGFSPASLAQEIGYRVGYFSARSIVDEWFARGTPNVSMSRFGGVNEFNIGSDTLTPQRLAQISAILNRAFVDQERSIAGLGRRASPLATAAISGFASYSIYNLKNSLRTNLIESNIEDKNEYLPNINTINKKEIIPKFRNSY